ncbi:hypothetical protein HY772_01590 [Candidatus Woesearchaeota archaeon]|nr:hypothetical protein [Candidatus Woesearchaeota archaeon]
MPKSKLLEDFKQQTKDELLRALLEVHDPSPNTSQEQKVSILVAKLEEIFKGRLNETTSN